MKKVLITFLFGFVAEAMASQAIENLLKETKGTQLAQALALTLFLLQYPSCVANRSIILFRNEKCNL